MTDAPSPEPVGAAEFAARRRALFERMCDGSVAILRTADQVERTFDTCYRFRPRSHFYHVTGFIEPEAWAVFVRRSASDCEYLLFTRRPVPEREAWLGKRSGPTEAVEVFGADRGYLVEQLDDIVPPLLDGINTVYYLFGRDDVVHARLPQWLRSVQYKVRRGVVAPTNLSQLETLVSELRLYKSAAEIALLQHAVDITVDGLLHVMSATRPGMHEYELEAELTREYLRRGAEPSFAPTVISGVDGCLSHYRERNAGPVRDGDLVLIDTGAEYEFYTSDLTVTYPANGRFSGRQRALYELVLSIERELMSLVSPGVTLDVPQGIVPDRVISGLLDLGVISGSYDEHLEKETWRRFFMHNMGHWLGLDIHDEATYAIDENRWRQLLPNMVMTLEPGIYVRSGTPDVNPDWWNIGARIEDNILVTEDGVTVMSEKIPRLPADIEAFMREARGKAPDA